MPDFSEYAARLNARARAHAELRDAIVPVTALRVSKSSATATERFALDAASDLQVRELPDYTGFYLSENKLWSGRGDTGFRLYRDGFIRPDGDHTQHYLEKDLIYGPQGFQGYCFDDEWMCGPKPILPWNYSASNLIAIDSASVIERLNERARRRAKGELI